MPEATLILVTGATGYVGGRLVPRLLAAGYRVRCLVRDPARLQGRAWLEQVEVATGDMLQSDSLVAAMRGVEVVYYLVHSLGGGGDFSERDLSAARNCAQAAKAAGVGRIIYLGGLGDPEANLSPHLRSRHETGAALREAGVPVTEFRAAVIVGSGSLSFEMIRYLTERLPVMICPKWVFTRIQPIAIRNVLDYLVAALECPASSGRTLEIGGKDVINYAEMMTGYAQARRLKRYLIAVPVLTPRLSSYWVHLVTPIPANIAQPLIKGLGNEVIVREASARGLFPAIQPLDYATAVKLALEKMGAHEVETAWSDALTSSQGDKTPVSLLSSEGMIMERRQRTVAAGGEQVYRSFARLGGERGWLYWDWTWQVRGMIDRLFGGVGMRRGRRDPEDLRVGDSLDFWRVELVEPGRVIRLRAEMKVPGRAWLEFKAAPQADGQTLLTQTAFFEPKGLFGLVYWYALYPIHSIIFSGLIRQLAKQAGGLLLPIVSALFFTMNTRAADKFIFDFQTVTNADAWQIVNDDVMGGVSTSQFHVTQGAGVFRGEVSLAHNGGFASVRSLPARLERAGGDSFVIRVHGDGHRYKFTARMDPSFDSAIYQAGFTTKPGVWEEYRLPLKQFIPTFRGRVLSGEPLLDAAKVTSVGFLISDQQAGLFQLKVEWIKVSVAMSK
jgi:uncharacterized protein YbjT (DUF2867 family)